MAYRSSSRRPNDNFTMVPNDWLRNPDLSWKAKAIGAYIASHRSDYALTTEQIIAEGTASKHEVRAALRELQAAGYLHRDQTRAARGRFGPRDVIFDFVPPETGNRTPALTRADGT